MREFYTTALCLILLSCLAAAPAGAEILDSSVAVVNEDVITLSDVNRAGKAIFEQIAAEAPPDQRDAALQQARENIIEQLVEKKLLMQQAALMNISVSEAELDHAQKQVLKRNGLSEDAFQTELRKIGVDEAQYRETLRDQLLSSKVINYQVRSKVAVPEERIREYYTEHYVEHVEQASSASYYLLQIGFVRGTGGSSQDAAPGGKTAREKVETVYALLKDGKDFKELARQYSELPSAADGGDIGFFQKDEMAPYMRDAITALQPGEISPVVESPNGYMIFKLLSSPAEGATGTKVPYDDVKQEIRDTLYKQEAEKRYKAWVKKIRSEAYIKIL
ncbi:MAG: peptidylprolyl isomerase [Candidatus Electrothrix sp. YB6]